MEVIMNLVQLIYASRMTEQCGPRELREILDKSREKNQSLGITGVLCYDQSSFLQCLEGARDVVNDLYNVIVADKRHKDIMLIHYSDIHRRDFEMWTMAYLNVEDLSKDIVFKYSIDRTFDPYRMSDKQALGFLTEITMEKQKFLKEQQEKYQAKKSSG